MTLFKIVRLIIPAGLPKGHLLALLPQLVRAIARDRDYKEDKT